MSLSDLSTRSQNFPETFSGLSKNVPDSSKYERHQSINRPPSWVFVSTKYTLAPTMETVENFLYSHITPLKHVVFQHWLMWCYIVNVLSKMLIWIYTTGWCSKCNFLLIHSVPPEDMGLGHTCCKDQCKHFPLSQWQTEGASSTLLSRRCD